MKKLIYTLFVFTLATNLTAQRIHEDLVPLSHPAKATGYKEQSYTVRSTCCFCGSQRTTLEIVSVIIGGLPGEYGDISFTMNHPVYNASSFEETTSTISEVPLVSLSQKGSNDIVSVKSIIQEDIKRIPSCTGEADKIAVLEVIGCPGTKDSENTDEKTAQGPITGLEGHNFVEEPALIYPNPVREVLNVKTTDPITVIEILNLHGEAVLILDPKNQMIVSDLAAGTYYARISFENRKDVQVEKILIIK